MAANPKRDYNLVAKILLGLSIVSFVLDTVTSVIKYRTYTSITHDGNQHHLIISALMNILLIIAAIMVFQKKKKGLLAFLILGVIKIFITIPFGTDVSTAYYLGGNSVFFLRDIGLFAIALCFRKNGISGWNSFFSSDEWIEAHFVERHKMVENTYENKVGDEENTYQDVMITKEVIHTDDEKREPEIEEKFPISNDQTFRKKGTREKIKRMNWKVIIPGIAVACILALFAVIGLKTYPKHINQFSDKFKYFFSIPNNSLAEEMFMSYRRSQEAGFDDTAIEYLNAAYIAKPSKETLLDSLAHNYFSLNIENGKHDSLYYARTISLCNSISVR